MFQSSIIHYARFFVPTLNIIFYFRQPNYVRTIEDEVELQRQRKLKELQEKGIKGTPVTEETFKLWQERKRKVKEDAVKKLVNAEMKKRKGGKGLSILSGRELFAYKQDLFKDDENEDENEDAIQKEASLEDNGESKLVDEDDEAIEKIAEKVESDLFLDGDDDELEDLDDMDDE